MFSNFQWTNVPVFWQAFLVELGTSPWQTFKIVRKKKVVTRIISFIILRKLLVTVSTRVKTGKWFLFSFNLKNDFKDLEEVRCPMRKWWRWTFHSHRGFRSSGERVQLIIATCPSTFHEFGVESFQKTLRHQLRANWKPGLVLQRISSALILSVLKHSFAVVPQIRFTLTASPLNYQFIITVGFFTTVTKKPKLYADVSCFFSQS